MGIPFFGLMIFAMGGEAYYKTNINDTYRFQSVHYGFMGRPQSYLIEKKHFFFEKEIAENITHWYGLRSVNLESENEKYFIIKIEKNNEIEGKTITYEKIKK